MITAIYCKCLGIELGERGEKRKETMKSYLFICFYCKPKCQQGAQLTEGNKRNPSSQHLTQQWLCHYLYSCSQSCNRLLPLTEARWKLHALSVTDRIFCDRCSFGFFLLSFISWLLFSLEVSSCPPCLFSRLQPSLALASRSVSRGFFWLVVSLF